jgi:hypothetical protein
LLVRVSVALTVPLTMGLKVMVKGTLWPAGMVTGSDSPPTLNTELLLLAAVTVTLAPLAVIVPDAVPLWPTTTLPRPRVVGAMESVPAVTVPVPDSGTVRVGFEALDAIVMLPVMVPATVGINFALKVQLAPGARVPPGSLQVPLPPQEKLADIASLVKVTVAFPVFVMVVVSTVLALPTAMLPKAMLAGLADRPLSPKLGRLRHLPVRLEW